MEEKVVKASWPFTGFLKELWNVYRSGERFDLCMNFENNDKYRMKPMEKLWNNAKDDGMTARVTISCLVFTTDNKTKCTKVIMKFEPTENRQQRICTPSNPLNVLYMLSGNIRQPMTVASRVKLESTGFQVQVRGTERILRTPEHNPFSVF